MLWVPSRRFLLLFSLLALAGPAAAGVWTRLGPDAGAVNVVAVDPSDPNVAYVTAPGSVFKSVDGGASWEALAFPNRNEQHSGIVVDPSSSATVYVTGEYDVYKSTDAGSTWTRHATPAHGLVSLAIDPAMPQRLYAGDLDGVAVSTDGGLTWSRTALPGAVGATVGAIVADPASAGTLYVAGRYGTAGSGVWKSTDGGATFHTTTLGVFDVNALAIDPSTGALFAGHAGLPVALEKSIDGGATWTPSNTGISTGIVPGGVVFDPAVPGRAYAANGFATYRSTDGGATWTIGVAGLTGAVRSIAVQSLVSGLVLVGTDRGVARSTDAASSWTPVNAGLAVDDTFAVTVDPTDPLVLYAGSGDSGIFKSTDGGVTWAAANAGLTSPTVYQVAVDPATPSTVLAVLGADAHVIAPTLLARSTDGAATWSTVFDIDTGFDAKAVAFAPSSPGVVYAGGGEFVGNPVWRSDDGGAVWNPTALPSGPIVTALAVDPTDADVVYAGAYVRGADTSVYKSVDGGATWTSMSVTGSPYGEHVVSLAIDPMNPQYLLASVSTDVFYRSLDGGADWTPLGLFNPGPVIFDSTGKGFAGIAFYGVWVTSNLGSTWTSVTGNLAPASPISFAVQSGVLYAGTAGGSVQRRPIGTCTTDEECDDWNLCTTDACAPANPGADPLGCTHATASCPAFDCRKAFCDLTRGCLYSKSPDNASCSDDGTSCTADLCQGGVCRHTPRIAPSCTAPLVAGGAQLSLKSAGNPKLALRLRRLDATPLASFGDPFTDGGTGFDVCVFDRSGAAGAPALRLAARAPAGGTCGPRPCWRSRGVSITYADRDATPDGLASMKLTSGAAGKAAVTTTGKGSNLVLPAGPLTPGVTVQVNRTDAYPSCWQATFDARVRVNTATEFKARSD